MTHYALDPLATTITPTTHTILNIHNNLSADINFGHHTIYFGLDRVLIVSKIKSEYFNNVV